MVLHIVLTHPQLKCTERLMHDTFGKAKLYLTSLSTSFNDDCKIGRYRTGGDLVCAGCRYAMCSWIDKLQLESMRSALNSIALGHQIPRDDHCDRCRADNGCCYLPHLVKIFKEGFGAIPQLTEPLHPGEKTGSN